MSKPKMAKFRSRSEKMLHLHFCPCFTSFVYPLHQNDVRRCPSIKDSLHYSRDDLLPPVHPINSELENSVAARSLLRASKKVDGSQRLPQRTRGPRRDATGGAPPAAACRLRRVGSKLSKRGVMEGFRTRRRRRHFKGFSARGTPSPSNDAGV